MGTVTGGFDGPVEHPYIARAVMKNEVLAPRKKKGYMIPIHLFLYPVKLSAGV
jgi:hypothetical protein